MYHTKDGLFFERLQNGDVRVVKTDGKFPADGGTVEFDVVLDADTWGSVVAEMFAYSQLHETLERYFREWWANYFDWRAESSMANARRVQESARQCWIDKSVGEREVAYLLRCGESLESLVAALGPRPIS